MGVNRHGRGVSLRGQEQAAVCVFAWLSDCFRAVRRHGLGAYGREGLPDRLVTTLPPLNALYMYEWLERGFIVPMDFAAVRGYSSTEYQQP